MSSGYHKLADKLSKIISESDSRKPKAYDTKATITRIEGKTVWVKIPGGENETPVQKTTNARIGDEVMVRLSNGRAWLLGNNTSPATDDTRANYAADKAATAIDYAGNANEAANSAINSANLAGVAAAQAQSSADDASEAAANAWAHAEEAWGYADSANTAATNAWNYADSANTAATNAWNHADDALTAANNANTSAASANRSANAALTQLSVVEDVVGVLEWISEHATYKASTDTEVVSGKMYFTRSGDTYTPVANPTGNPSTSGYYEIDNIDEAVSNYVSSHLSLTNQGLWVVNDNNSYKILLASDGMKVYDSSGNLVSTFGESISFSSSRAQYIGNNNTYIAFNPTNGGSITINGATIQLVGGQTLEEVLSNTLIYDHIYEYNVDGNGKKISATFTAFLYRAGVDVKNEYDPTCFSWSLKKEDEDGITKETLLGTGYTMTVSLANCGYGAEIVGRCTIVDEAEALTVNNRNLTNSDGDNITVRASGDSVRVRDLSVTTTIFPTDKLLIVGASDEHLVTIQTLQDYLNTNLDKQVLFDTTSGWNSQTTLQSRADTLYVYTDYQTDSSNNTIAGIKVGDGNAYVVDLPFIDAIAMEHIANTTVHVTAEERTAWNNKVRCYYAGTENLIFTTA